jgi:thiamine biosynthesis lipoprotein
MLAHSIISSEPALLSRQQMVDFVRGEDHWIGRFTAMACPCEVLVEQVPESVARRIVSEVSRCAWRIEAKFSRYRDDNVVHKINTSVGRPVTVDEETAKLLDFAATLTQLSEGRFDITCGVLRKAWRFDGGSHVPSQSDIDALLPLVGWQRVSWESPVLSLQPACRSISAASARNMRSMQRQRSPPASAEA